MGVEAIKELDRNFHIGVYGDPRFFDFLPVKADGVIITDSNGKEYIDCVGGIACNSLGYNDSDLNNALIDAIKRGILHLSNLFYSETQAKYAVELCGVLPMKDPKVFFCGSGADAVNGAIKCAAKNKGNPKSDDYHRDRDIFSYYKAFHGRVGPALAVTDPKYHKDKGFDPTLPKGVKFIHLNDEAGLEKITEKTYAVIVEPIQGEGGIIEATYGYMRKLRRKCTDVGALLIVDEVQTGFARTGRMFATEYKGIKPDIMCLAKGISGGVQFGAFAVNKKADLLKKGEHATTFGGNELGCAAGLEVLKQIYLSDLVLHAKVMERFFFDWYNHSVQPDDNVIDARGRGLMLGLEFSTEKQRNDVISGCVKDGVLFAPAGRNTLRLVPPLVIGHNHFEEEDQNSFEKALEVLQNNIKKLKK